MNMAEHSSHWYAALIPGCNVTSCSCMFSTGIAMVFCSSFPPACVYYLLWSMSYILFPASLWSCKV